MKAQKVLSMAVIFMLALFACKDSSDLLTNSNNSQAASSLSSIQENEAFRAYCRDIATGLMEEGKWDGVNIIKAEDSISFNLSRLFIGMGQLP